ncbi:MAG: hypothetical protein JW932_19060, partial [Deltaproteobacteria bacterium]|nr:hypothetical protein [Deltaproteobacteria bacterium]
EDTIRKINSYINLYAMTLCGLLSIGVTGFLVYFYFGGVKDSLIPLSFFTSAGFGFILAYSFDPDFGYKYKKQIRQEDQKNQ